jgi:hypothetical protein
LSKKLKQGDEVTSVLPTSYQPSGVYLKGTAVFAGVFIIWMLVTSIYGYDIFN